MKKARARHRHISGLPSSTLQCPLQPHALSTRTTAKPRTRPPSSHPHRQGRLQAGEDDTNTSTEGGGGGVLDQVSKNLSSLFTTTTENPPLPTIWTHDDPGDNVTTMTTATTDCTLLDYDYDPIIALISVALFISGLLLRLRLPLFQVRALSHGLLLRVGHRVPHLPSRGVASAYGNVGKDLHIGLK